MCVSMHISIHTHTYSYGRWRRRRFSRILLLCHPSEFSDESFVTLSSGNRCWRVASKIFNEPEPRYRILSPELRLTPNLVRARPETIKYAKEMNRDKRVEELISNLRERKRGREKTKQKLPKRLSIFHTFRFCLSVSYTYIFMSSCVILNILSHKLLFNIILNTY